MNTFNTLKKTIAVSLFLLVSSISFANPATPLIPGKNQIHNELSVNNGSLLMPTTPLGMAILIFMLIVALAFGITRLKSSELSMN